MTKTRYQAYTEQRLGRSIPDLALAYEQADHKSRFANEVDVPEQTLRNWAREYVVVEKIVRVREKACV